jgi:hypothetical protein
MLSSYASGGVHRHAQDQSRMEYLHTTRSAHRIDLNFISLKYYTMNHARLILYISLRLERSTFDTESRIVMCVYL